MWQVLAQGPRLDDASMRLERHDIMHATELFDLSKEDRRLHMSKLRGETINEWLNYKADSSLIVRMMAWCRRYYPE